MQSNCEGRSPRGGKVQDLPHPKVGVAQIVTPSKGVFLSKEKCNTNIRDLP